MHIIYMYACVCVCTAACDVVPCSAGGHARMHGMDTGYRLQTMVGSTLCQVTPRGMPSLPERHAALHQHQHVASTYLLIL